MEPHAKIWCYCCEEEVNKHVTDREISIVQEEYCNTWQGRKHTTSICLSVCVFVCVCACVRACLSVFVFVFVHVCFLFICLFICLFVSLFVCLC